MNKAAMNILFLFLKILFIRERACGGGGEEQREGRRKGKESPAD